MASSEYKLAVVNGTSLTLSLNGPAGPTGATGATGATGGVTSVAGRTGAITLVSADITNATSFATPDTLVKRDASGNFSGEFCGFTEVNAGGETDGVTIGPNGVYFYVLDAQTLLRSTSTE